MKAYLFNPENDMALAAGTAAYTPPSSVRRFKEALAQLPRWIADEGDIIMTPGIKISETDVIPSPWGWSRNAVFQFQKAGISGPFPDVDKIRELSHRRTALKLHRELQNAGLPYPLPPEPEEITDASRIERTDIMLKTPWSCSGRGVVDCSQMTTDGIRRVAEGVIRKQGSVMIEPKLPKKQDFALLFMSNGGKVTYEGLSVFFNSATSTSYSGNICASQEELREIINTPYLDETIIAVRNALESILSEEYEGPVGVDMITYGAENLICPTIEVNLRLTMGFMALSLFKRLGRGTFRITTGTSDGLQLVTPNPYFSATFQPS